MDFEFTDDQLSLRDLLDARDQHHIHLLRHANVVATAIGLSRIRTKDSWPTEQVASRLCAFGDS